MKLKCIFLVVCLMFIVLFFGCTLESRTNNGNEVFMKKYYKKEDFQSIIIGQSNYHDVYKIASVESMQITSYGGVCEYPMQDGGCVRIKFYGKELIVGAIDEVFL